MTANERIAELLVDQITESLADVDRAELEELLARHPDVDRHIYERAATTVFLASAGGTREDMPASLSARLETDAEQILGKQD